MSSGHTVIASLVVALAVCHVGMEARAQSVHPFCLDYQRLCQQEGDPNCQIYQQYCASSEQAQGAGRFSVDTGEWRAGIGIGGFFGSYAEGAMPVYMFFGPKIERGIAIEESFRGLQLIPELGLDVQFPFSGLSDDATRVFPVNSLIGLRVLWGFGVVSVGVGGHAVLGGIELATDDEEESYVWRFSSGLRAALEVNFYDGALGFELNYTWMTEFQDVHLHSITLSFFLDVIRLGQAVYNWTPS